MFDSKKLIKKLLFPPIWMMVLLALTCAALLVFVFVKGYEQSPVAYAVYVISFYSLSVITIYFVIVFPKYYRSIKQKAYDNKYSNRFLTDVKYRTRVKLHSSLLFNLMYVALNLASGFYYKTAWFICLAVYYIILAAMRFLLVRYINEHSIGENMPGEWKRSRICACALTLINLALSGVVLMILYQNKGFKYHGILIYVMAMYTFYITTIAIVNLIKYRKYKSPVITSTNIITLTASLVSMLSLETAMLTAFGENTDETTKYLLIAITGAAISIVVTALSSYMIISSTKNIKLLSEGKINESK